MVCSRAPGNKSVDVDQFNAVRILASISEMGTNSDLVSYAPERLGVFHFASKTECSFSGIAIHFLSCPTVNNQYLPGAC